MSLFNTIATLLDGHGQDHLVAPSAALFERRNTVWRRLVDVVSELVCAIAGDYRKTEYVDDCNLV
ncbi:hypothetical protein C8R47DRAFT_1228925 [Mycena vitilis]|nr:hypothetical protein C8R47DRAFT_1228925 [Mycena vitilis]